MILALTDRRAPHRTDKADDLHKFYHDPASFKELSDNRDRYLAQSRATRNGVVAPLPPRRQTQALPSPPCPGSGRPGVVALDSDEPEYDHPDYLVDYG